MTISKSKHTIWIKIRKCLTFLSDAFCVIYIGLGHGDNSLPVLIGRVGVSAILNSINEFLIPEK